MSANFRLSIEGDSLNESRGESEAERLRDELKKRQSFIEDQNKIIASLRQQVKDFQDDAEEFENSEQRLKQEIDRLKKEMNEKVEELEAVSHALNQMETANESLTNRYEARKGQVQKFATDLTNTKRELDESLARNQELQNKNELLTIELDSARTRKLASHKRQRDDDEVLTQEIQDLRSQIHLLKKQNSNLLVESEKQLEQLKNTHQQEGEKQIEELRNQILEMKQRNECLTNELKSATSKKLSLSSSDREQTNEELIQELYDLRAKVKSLSHRQSRRSIDEEILKLKQELDVTETSWKLERQHKERYARENLQLDKKLNELNKELAAIRQSYALVESKCIELNGRLREQMLPPPPLPPKTTSHGAQSHDESKSELTSAIHFSMADEVGEIMDSSSITSVLTKEKRMMGNPLAQARDYQSQEFRGKRCTSVDIENIRSMQQQPPTNNYCTNHRIQKSQLFNNDPIAEQKMRIERANELARRNMQTKPLHQTSYPLELDTFDTSNLTETDIKRGNVRRQALVDFSNQRRPIKKAEAFVV